MRDILVYFGNNLSKEDFRDDDTRAQVLNKGVKAAEILQGVTVLNRLENACAARIQVESEDTMDMLKAVLNGLTPVPGWNDRLDQQSFRPAS